MINPGLAIIEEVFSLGLNPDEDYEAQLGQLSASGELSNKTTTNSILFKLCKVIDEQAKQIKALQDDRVEIANKMLELEGGKKEDANTTPTTPAQPDPTQPLQS